MVAASATSLVAMFPNRGQAEGAIDQLWHSGFAKEQVRMAMPGEHVHQATTRTEATENRGAAGAATGALAGALFGTFAGLLAVLLVPDLGPTLTGSAFMGILGATAAGAALGCFAGPFLAMGVAQQANGTGKSDLEPCKAMVVVRTDHDQDRALLILQEHGPVEVHVGGFSTVKH